MKRNKTKLWIKSLWKYLWFKPVYVLHKEKETDFDNEVYEWEEGRWYVHKRVTSWLLLLPIAIIPIFMYSGLKGIFGYIEFVFTYRCSWVCMEKNVSFKRKLDIVNILTR